jgi:hypothetical protein
VESDFFGGDGIYSNHSTPGKQIFLIKDGACGGLLIIGFTDKLIAPYAPYN